MMTSFLIRNRTKEDYLEKITNEPIGTQKNKRFTISNFEKFVANKFKEKTFDDVLEEINNLSNTEKEVALYDLLQDWINWNHHDGKNNSTIRAMFSFLRHYLYFRGVKTNPQDIKENLKFGKKIDNERHPLSKEEYMQIVNYFRNPKRQALYLVLGSSGMRIGEALRLKKKDLDFSPERIKIKIPAEITKTRKGRSTYISKEASGKLKFNYYDWI
ncbi:MAG TPA: hypothetical protein ENH95_03005 [Nitrosopumilus sp.]|nr:hypothetical protein [Nitrosopumilus sp.]